ncbi:hypothetical protein [Nocardia pseudovaccinii]|uniref:hypothetical protein n=1 Tax=Nocardia pseudovaccinii TaxID=189540 RepID=UPI0012F5299F|nr:hypothetical protein [Nocardia pseudovaccinii]
MTILHPFRRHRADEVTRLRAALADRDRQLAELGRRLDDALDRESMHVNAPDMERLATSAAIERYGARRACRRPGPAGRPQLKALAATVLTVTAPHIL